MRSLLSRLVVLLALCAVALPAEAQRVALVIGNAAYQAAPRLANPIADAEGVAASLTRLGFRVDLVRNTTRPQLEAALRRFAQAADGAELAFFFYAGHGMQIGGENWLVPVEARLRHAQDVDFELVGMPLVMRAMERARARVLILDACRDNPLATQMAGAGGTRSLGAGLARLDAPDLGTLIAFATAPGAVAQDGNGRNSPFTAGLLRHMEEPGLELRQMLTRVRRSVLEATGGRQVPWENSSLVAEVVLRPVGTPPGVLALPGQAAQPAATPTAPLAGVPAAPSNPALPPGATAPTMGFLTLPPHLAHLAQPQDPAPPGAEPAARTTQPAQPPQPSQPPRAERFACPPAGLQVRYQGERREVTFEGHDPRDPVLCFRNAEGERSTWLFNLIRMPWPSGSWGVDSAARRAVTSLFPLKPGNTASFDGPLSTDSSSSGGGIASNFVAGQTARYTFTVQRLETVRIAGRAFEAAVIETRVEGWNSPALHIITSWIDLASFAVLRSNMRVERGYGGRANVALSEWNMPEGAAPQATSAGR